MRGGGQLNEHAADYVRLYDDGLMNGQIRRRTRSALSPPLG
jgi:hypothetical protein